MTQRLRRLKLGTFGTEEVEIKSNWLRIDHERRHRYLNKFNLGDDELKRFVEGVYDLIHETDLVLLAGVVDKVHMRQQYGDSAWYPPAAAYEVIVQRAQMELSEKSPESEWTVVVDDMTGATPYGNQYRVNLKRHHRQLKKTGSVLWRGHSFPNLQDLVFVDSRTSHLTQAADIVAYNVFRQFRDHGEDWEDDLLSKLPTYDWFGKLASKFRQDRAGRIQGFGVVKIPLLRRVPWKIERNKE